MNRALFLIIIGLGGAAILVSLGVWQVQRLAWKQGVITEIDARILDAPVDLPTEPSPTTDSYLPVSFTGLLGRDYLRVLVSKKVQGAGYRIIMPMRVEDGTLMLDIGFAPVDADFRELSVQDVHGAKKVVGNLQWPQETDNFTPEPDLKNNIWFARDVTRMAAALGTRPILVVLREPSQEIWHIASPMPVDTSRIPNDHLQYAITWFSLAAVWLAMSLLFLRRRAAPQSESET